MADNHPKITSRAILGELYFRLEQGAAQWVQDLAFNVESDQGSEEHAWLGMSPMMREWIGGRNVEGLRESSFTIKNRPFESTIGIPVPWIRRDKTGQIMRRINDLAQRTNMHGAKLLSELVISGESTVCYDGQFFFDTDHEEGESSAQSNDLSIDISALPVSLWSPTVTGVMSQQLSSGQTNPVAEMQRQQNIKITVVPNPRLTWTEKFVTFRRDRDNGAAPFIRQEEKPLTVSSQAEGSAEEFYNDRHVYGTDWNGNYGFGFWQHACLGTLT